MAKCKYPNEVCANMTMLNGTAYCDSVPCSLKDEVPKQTNADKIRAMSDEDLADYIFGVSESLAPCVKCSEDCDFCELSDEECKSRTLEWLQSEA